MKMLHSRDIILYSPPVVWEFDGLMGDSSGSLLAMFSVVGLAITQIVTEFNRVKYPASLALEDGEMLSSAY